VSFFIGDHARVSRCRTQNHHLGVGVSKEPEKVGPGQARLKVVASGDDHPLELLVFEQTRKCLAVGAAALNAGIDSDVVRRGSLLDSLEQRHADAELTWNWALEREGEGDGGEERRHERRFLDSGEADGRVERSA
jgi:hypothetical protein